jgi:hypothetical protein
MKLNKKFLMRLAAGIILGGLAGAGVSYVYGLTGLT